MKSKKLFKHHFEQTVISVSKQIQINISFYSTIWQFAEILCLNSLSDFFADVRWVEVGWIGTVCLPPAEAAQKEKFKNIQTQFMIII